MDKSKLQCMILGHNIAPFEMWNHEENIIDGYCERCKLWKTCW